MINPTVEGLLVLQERDTRVTALTTELGHLPRQIADVEDQLAARVAKFDELKARTRQIEADRKKIDLDVQAKQGAIARYRSQQQQTRKNEEFAALNHEIEHAEKEISALEDSELELMEAYDKGLAEVAEAQKELAVFRRNRSKRRLISRSAPRPSPPTSPARRRSRPRPRRPCLRTRWRATAGFSRARGTSPLCPSSTARAAGAT